MFPPNMVQFSLLNSAKVGHGPPKVQKIMDRKKLNRVGHMCGMPDDKPLKQV